MMRSILCAALCMVLLYSCGGGSGKASQVFVNQQTPVKTEDLTLAKVKASGLVADNQSSDTTAMAAPQNVPQSGVPGANPDWDKKIIKTANVTLELKDYNAYNSGIRAKVKSFGAYIAQEQQDETYNQITNEITVKVPVEKFDDLVNSLGGEGIKVVQKNISSQDVTGEVIDTKARLEAKKQVRDRYLDLLKQAKTMKDILDVQEQVNTIQEDIESATGRVDYLVHSAAYSTVNIKYYQFLNGVTEKDIEPTFINKIAEAFKTGWQIIMNIILFCISVWPLVAAGVFLVFYFKRNNAKRTKQLPAA